MTSWPSIGGRPPRRTWWSEVVVAWSRGRDKGAIDGAGILLLSGLYARVGGFLGMGTMLPAIYATLVLAGMSPGDLPAGIAAVPEVPPLPVPVLVLLSSVYVAWRGGGAWSLDARIDPAGQAVGDPS